MDDSSMDSSMMDASDMMMTFFQSQTTPLWSMAFMPSGASTYAGTCIFLIFFAIIHRLLVAFRSVVFDTNPNLISQAYLRDSETDKESFTSQRIQPPRIGSIRQLFHDRSERYPFHVPRETGRACLELIISGMGYLLMLAIMTLNVGYFLSVLAGIFLGTFAVGRFGGAHH
ncbi:Ctr copper transporter [Xylariaceae sp. FL0255]|nr:Ctr copper transporter [Xylariaceae sp. FL0255]